MPIKNSLAGCCYLCAGYVAIGKGELLKNYSSGGPTLVVGGHRFVVRCAGCSVRAAKPSATPTEGSMSPAAANLYRQSLRKTLRELLADEDMPPELSEKGHAWLEAATRDVQDLHRFKDRIIQVRNEHRGRRLNGHPAPATR